MVEGQVVDFFVDSAAPMHKLSGVVGLSAGIQIDSAAAALDRVNRFAWKGARHETVELGENQVARFDAVCPCHRIVSRTAQSLLRFDGVPIGGGDSDGAAGNRPGRYGHLRLDQPGRQQPVERSGKPCGCSTDAWQLDDSVFSQ